MIFDSSVPVLTRLLGNLSAMLSKAETHCKAKKIDPEAMLQARLFPDMFAFTRQVQLACDFAKGAGARLAGLPVPSFPDEEKTFADLQARIDKTRAFLSGLAAEQFADAPARTITLKVGGQELTFRGQDYLDFFVLPNFYFHLTTAYALLRHNGVELGKRDFMGMS